jgi:hypothetical protein
VAAVRHPAGALAGPQMFPNSAQSAFGHAESFYIVIVDLPWPSTSSLRKPCKKGVDARDNSRIGSGDRHGGGGWFDEIGTSPTFCASRSARSRNAVRRTEQFPLRCRALQASGCGPRNVTVVTPQSACRAAESLTAFAVCVSPSPTPPRARGVTLGVWRSLCALRAHVVHIQVSSVGHRIGAAV